MAFGKDLGIGLKTYGNAFNFIFKHNLWYYYLFPLIIWGTIFWLTLQAGAAVADEAELYLMKLFGLDPNAKMEDLAWYEMIWHYFSEGLALVSGFAVKFTLGIFSAWFSKYLMLILMSPILALLSEKTEEILTGNEYPFEWGQFMRDIWRGIVIAIRNMMIELLVLTGVTVVCFFFPPLAIILWPFTWVVSWYFLGFAMIDYVSERRRFSVSQSNAFVKKHSGLAIGNGWLFATTLAVTSSIWLGAIGFMIAPINACVGATLAVHEIDDLSNSPYGNQG